MSKKRVSLVCAGSSVRLLKTSCSQLVPVRGGPITRKEGRPSSPVPRELFARSIRLLFFTQSQLHSTALLLKVNRSKLPVAAKLRRSLDKKRLQTSRGFNLPV